MRRLVGLLLALACPALADPVVIVTEPPHLGIYQHRQSLTEDRFLGYSGEPVTVELFNGEAHLYFVYVRPGQVPKPDHAALQLTLKSGDLKQERFPQGSEPYRPTLPPGDLADYQWRTRGRWLALGAGLTVALIGAVVTGLARSRGRVQRRLRKLEELIPVDSGDALLGSRVGPYLLVARLGAGGMATVYRGVPADSLDESQAVAVKMIARGALADGESEARFQREWEVSRELFHPNIVKMIEWGEEGDYRYLVMELVVGETLRSQLTGQGLPPQRAFRLLEPIMQALSFSHARGIVHRDLKPENVMLSFNPTRVIVMDFGLARSHRFETVTVTGNVLGTPAYMAPEQINGKWEARTDQYALGVMAYEMLTGKRPFEQEDAIQMILAHLQTEPVPLRTHKPTLSPRLEQWVLKMLAKDPEDRFPTMEAALQAWPG